MNSYPVFSKEVFTKRRQVLKSKFAGGKILLPGNDESSSNFKDNWYPFRQDSSFLYYAGIPLAGLVLLMDTGSGDDILFGIE